MKKFHVPAIAFFGIALFGVPALAANSAEEKPYNPVEALRAGRDDTNRDSVGLPQKLRDDSISFSFAPEYFFDFGSDLPDADGWGASIAAAAAGAGRVASGSSHSPSS